MTNTCIYIETVTLQDWHIIDKTNDRKQGLLLLNNAGFRSWKKNYIHTYMKNNYSSQIHFYNESLPYVLSRICLIDQYDTQWM